MSPQDLRFMRMALALGTRGLGDVWPNPSVGCVIVREGRVVGRGWTAKGGRPHAETEALRRAGPAARGATVYVTLEPCANWGCTPPCADALVEAGIARIVVACVDPDPRVDGKGLARLREAGIEVEYGCLKEQAREAHLGLFKRIRRHRPMVALKLAASLDGRIATAGGASKWITGAWAREEAHRLRATHDAVLVGSGTVLADDPELTCRLPGLAGRSPVRVVLDRRLRLPLASRLVQTVESAPLWVITGMAAPEAPAAALEAAGARILRLPEPEIESGLHRLAARGITRLLVEGGAAIATSLVAQGLVDRLYLFQAPVLLGGDGLPLTAALGLSEPAAAGRWRSLEDRRLGEDRLLVLAPSEQEH